MNSPDLSASGIGRRHDRRDVVTAAPAASLAALLDRDDAEPVAGDPLPLPWHWLYFLPRDRQAALGSDGHPARSKLLGESPLPRRMWAGGRLSQARPLRIGAAVERASTVAAVRSVEGRSGPLVFVTVRHEIVDASGMALVEEQDLVYREWPGAEVPRRAPAAAPTIAQFTRTVVPDPTLLFRYSALTFNAHRIHYDRPYAREVEGYPGLVVQGPLLATLLLELLRDQDPTRPVAGFDFKSQAPLFDLAPFTLCGRIDTARKAKLWACDDTGAVAMSATARFA